MEIGEELEFDGIIIKCELYTGNSCYCGECYFLDKMCQDEILGSCLPNSREDGNNVIFRKIKEETN